MNATDYDKQAKDFLERFGISIRIRKTTNQEAPKWADGGPHGNRYRVVLKADGRNNLAFPFWGSQHDASKGVDPSEYDILACLSGDAHCPDTFADFCGEYCYDEDSRKALAQFKRCDKFAQDIRRFFSEEELDALSEIQ